jgi:sortase A
VLYPIIEYEIEANSKYPTLISPVVKNNSESYENYDYTKASNWFPGAAKSQDFVSEKVTHYKITIPSLGIQEAVVSIGGEDLADSLIQYPGTQVPGKVGNSVIFGHSILPYFFDPENYLAIFSTLPEMSSGDDVYVNYDGISYKYEVDSMFEVKPEDIQILEQDKANSYLTLVTCTPPGHPLKPKRLIVRAKLVPTTQSGEFSKQTNADIRN